MDLLVGAGEVTKEVHNQRGSLRVTRRSQRAVWAELRGAIGLDHVRPLTAFMDECIQTSPVKLILFQDLAGVDSYGMRAQIHVAEWAREQVEHMEKLHFAITGKVLLPTIRAMFMSLPVRAYMHHDRSGLQSALERAG